MVIRKTSAVPEQGQIVTVRQRRYVVVDVQPSNLPIQPLSVQQKESQNLLTLNCIEDDAIGETIQVFWELEFVLTIPLSNWLQTCKRIYRCPGWVII